MKRIICILISCAVISCLAITVYAHPGMVDAIGGHYDKSTGEYHYHHGYPAHAHYDMDGDGTLDCPYNFDDKTGQSSGSSSSGSSKNNGAQKNTNSNNSNTKSGKSEKIIQETPETNKISRSQDYIFWVLVVAVCCGLFALSYFGKHYQEDDSDKKRKREGVSMQRTWILRPVAWICTIIMVLLMNILAAISINFIAEVIDWMRSLPAAVRITFLALLGGTFLSILITEALYIPGLIVWVSDFIYPSKHAFRYYFVGIFLIIDYAVSAIEEFFVKEEGVSITITCIYFVYLIVEYITLIVTGHHHAEDRNR